MNLCQAITHGGSQCTRSSSDDSSYCWQHIDLTGRERPEPDFNSREFPVVGRFRLPPIPISPPRIPSHPIPVVNRPSSPPRIASHPVPVVNRPSSPPRIPILSQASSPSRSALHSRPNSLPQIALHSRANSPPQIALHSRPNSPPRIKLPNSASSKRLTIETSPPMIDKNG